MRTFGFVVFAVGSLCGVAFAQQGTPTLPAKATHIEEVLNANPLPEGNAYRIDLLLGKGKRVSYEVAPAGAAKIADGLSKPATAGGQSRQVATLAYGMNVQVDSNGLAVILTPRGKSGPLEPFAIPIAGAEVFVALMQSKIAEAKANAAKRQ